MTPRPSPGRSGPPLSQVLAEIGADTSRQRISVGDISTALQDRAIGALIFVFALPNIAPMPPGTSSILGAPLLFLTAQLALGRKPWLPRLIAERSMQREQFNALIAKVAPWIARVERLLRPRLTILTTPPCEYVIGVLCLLLSVILFLPIPMGNMPPAIAICMFSLAVLERDGVWVLGACAATAASLAVIWGVLFALLRTGVAVLEHWVG